MNLTRIESLSPMLNISNSKTSINSTMEDSTVPEELEIASLVILFISSIIGSYLFFNLQRYLKTKAPGVKTILDELYIKLFSIWLVEVVFIVVTCFQMTSLREVDLPWLWAVVVIYADYSILFLSYLHLLVCLLCNITLIYAPQITEEMNDKLVLRLIM